MVLMLAALHPSLVKKAVLVASGPFEDRYVPEIQKTRLGRLEAGERAEVTSLMSVIEGRHAGDREKAFARFGELFSRTDAFDAFDGGKDEVILDPAIFRSVWEEAARMRTGGQLLRLAKRVSCPVMALHGDHDPHPASGVRDPLSRVLQDFRFVLLTHCGHKPWVERRAKDDFFRVLEGELA